MRCYYRRKAGGRCACGEDLDTGRVQCAKCRAVRKAKTVERKSRGLCPRCSQPTRPGKTTCAKCSGDASARLAIQYRRIKAEVFAAYGNKCSCCGKTNPAFLSLEHKEGGGGKHRRELGGGSAVYKWAKKNNFPDTLTLLCFDCNCSKGYFGKCGCHNWTPDRLTASAGTLSVF